MRSINRELEELRKSRTKGKERGGKCDQGCNYAERKRLILLKENKNMNYRQKNKDTEQ